MARTINGTEGSDNLTVTGANSVVYGYGGNDTILNNNYNGVKTQIV